MGFFDIRIANSNKKARSKKRFSDSFLGFSQEAETDA